MTQHKCSGCNHLYCNLSASYCMHRDNYAMYLTDYMITTDAGYLCPLNLAQEDYISVVDQKAREELAERARQSTMIASAEEMFGTID